jgi:hypothetical protein
VVILPSELRSITASNRLFCIP